MLDASMKRASILPVIDVGISFNVIVDFLPKQIGKLFVHVMSLRRCLLTRVACI